MQRLELTIGDNVFTVYGGAGEGWSFDPKDFDGPVPPGARYATVDEIYFALANLSLSERAEA